MYTSFVLFVQNKSFPSAFDIYMNGRHFGFLSSPTVDRY